MAHRNSFQDRFSRYARAPPFPSLRAGPGPYKGGRAAFEGADHALHGVVEHHADDPLQDRVAEFEIDEELHLAAALGRSRNAQLDFMWRNGPSRYSVSIRFFSGQRVTRLAKCSRNTLNEITRSASITSPPPGIGVRALMRAAEFQGRNFG